MKTKHTPGPWVVEGGFDKEGNGLYFPTVVIKPDSKNDYDRGFVINKSHDQEAESIMANARLIASAPELLEALNGLVKEYGIDGIASFNEALSVAEKAIAKAEGG